MKKLVVSQPMFFPWWGMFNQLQLCDVFIHYDDAQMPLGRSFINRVQIKTPNGISWMTIPICQHGKQKIKDVRIDNTQRWQKKHLNMIQFNLGKAPYFSIVKEIVSEIYKHKYSFLVDFNIHSFEYIAEMLNINSKFGLSSNYPSTKKSSERLVEIVKENNACEYITGHGAKNYLDHLLFEENSITVKYMDYNIKPYHQLFSGFTPYVSILDLLANVGVSATSTFMSRTIPWNEFTNS